MTAPDKKFPMAATTGRTSLGPAYIPHAYGRWKFERAHVQNGFHGQRGECVVKGLPKTHRSALRGRMASSSKQNPTKW